MITLESVTKHYGKFVAVDNLNLDIKPGEVFGFLGPNGAGKTTTLRMITGLIQPTSGTITIGGKNMADEPIAAKAMMGFIPDRPYLYEKLTAFEFMRFVAGLYRMRRKDAASRIEELLERFGLLRWTNTLVENFSHGMKQRLVFASALLPRPKLLVVDEPMVGLDPNGARLVKTVFTDLCADTGMTVFLSTHSLDVAEEVCERIAILHKGKLRGLGTLSELEARSTHEDAPGGLVEVFFALTEAAKEEESAHVE